MSGVAATTAASPPAASPPAAARTSVLILGAIASRRRPFVGLAVGMVAWEVIGRLWNVDFFPPLSEVLVRLVQMVVDGEIVSNLETSLSNLVLGFAVSATFGLVVGGLMGAYRKVDLALDPYIYALLTAPSLVFAPLFFSLFGLSQITVIGVIFVYSAWIMVINTATAIRSVPQGLVEMGRSYCATDRQLFFEVILPAATPLIMAGLRLGMGRAVKGMINGEMFIAAVGLGYLVIQAEGSFDDKTVLAILLVIIVVALLALKLVEIVDHRLTSWLPSTAREARRR